MRQPYTYTMPEEFMHDQSVPAHWRLLGVLNGFFINKRSVHASNKWLAEQLGCSERTITDAVAKLEVLGKVYVKRTKRTRVIHDVKGSNQLLPPSQPTAISDSNQLLSNADRNADRLTSANAEEIRVVKDDEEKLKIRDAVDKVSSIFKEVTGRQASFWKIRTNQRQAAINLLKDRTPEQIRSALVFYVANRDEKYCPQINSPLELEEKWFDLLDFKKKHGD